MAFGITTLFGKEMELPKPIAALLRSFAGRARDSLSPEELARAKSLAEDQELIDYCSVGAFSPPEARVVLALFQKSSARFQVRCDTSAGSVGINGDFWDRGTIEIYVHADDTAKGQKIVEEWRLSVGKVAR